MQEPCIKDVYNEIIQISRSVGECHSSIDHVEDSMIRIYNELKNGLDKIDSRLSNLESEEKFRKRRSKFIWNMINISPANIAKWISVLILTGSIITTMLRLNVGQNIYKIFQFAIG